MTLSAEQEYDKLTFCVKHAETFWKSANGHSLWQKERSLITSIVGMSTWQQGLEFTPAPEVILDDAFVRHPIQWVCSKEEAQRAASLVCHPSLLPLENESIDVTVLHHILEVVPQPHHLLGEAARVTADDGLLIIVGWNPVGSSIIDRSRLCRQRARLTPHQRTQLKHQHWRSVSRLKDWLAFVDFEVKQVHYIGYTTPRSDASQRVSIGWLNALPIGRSFVVIAKRKQWRVIPLKPGFSSKLSLGLRSMGLSACTRQD
ncbi:hypothetical protein LMG33818_000201 [Halomonadaceae bacterium LMG 33818]|uniref:class I SAM-dependent methyltransferase n=1 Tax=Cernens ardua TaxID=3402176 RepID=UPI003EDB720F